MASGRTHAFGCLVALSVLVSLGGCSSSTTSANGSGGASSAGFAGLDRGSAGHSASGGVSGAAGSGGASGSGAAIGSGGASGASSGCRSNADCSNASTLPGSAQIATCLSPFASPPGLGFGCGAVQWCGQCSCPPMPIAPYGNGASCSADMKCPAPGAADAGAEVASICNNGTCTECATTADCPAARPACASVGGSFGQGFRACTECASDADCGAAKPHCVLAPGVGGSCQLCSTTRDCASGVCSQNACVPGCDAQHPCTDPVTRCSAAQRCEAIPCSGSSACPLNMQCAAGYCARSACSSDADCEGYCVNKECQEKLGICYTPELAP